LLLIISIISLLLIGVYFAFQLKWQEEFSYFFGYGDIIILFSFGISSLLIDCLISNLKKKNYNVFTKINKEKISLLKTELGQEKLNKLEITSSLTFGVSFVLLIFFLLIGVNKFEQYQLNKNGKEILIEITQIKKGPKGHKLAYFEYTHNGLKYGKELFLNEKVKNEKYLIIYSKNHPRIVNWAE
uniref:hypothetical protein n=1 Tax=Algibacter mikhailovii TaxID=425498 RepID=UPI002493D6FF